MKKYLFILALINSFPSFSQSWQDTVSKIEKAFERYKPSMPGAQVCIARNGTILFSKAYGMADLERNVALTTTSRIEAGSVSKQFTAGAILLLEQEGKLNLNDNVRKYLPELPDYGTPITLRQMINHTSGLKDWGTIGYLAGWPRFTKAYNNDDALYITSKQKSLNNVPGAVYIYSNSNYNLLAIIVQRVSGQTLAEYTAKKIFEPAGMSHTEWRADYRKVVPNRAIAYSKDGNEYVTDMPNEYVYGNGGLLTTAEDLVKWNEYYQSGKFGNPSLLSKQSKLTPLTGGQHNRYGAGLFIGESNGWPYYAHDGRTAGYRAFLEYFPAQKLSFSLLSNNSEFNVDDVENALFTLFIPDNSKPSPPAQAPYTIAPAILSGYAGWYRSLRDNTYRFYVQDNKLRATGIGELVPRSPNKFSAGNTSNIYIFTNQPKKEILLIRDIGDSIYFSRQDSAIVNEQTMKEYVGRYHSDEVEATTKIEYKNGELILSQLSGRGAIRLLPTYKDGFTGDGGAIIFERDKKGRVVGYSHSVERARGMRFGRVE